MAFTVLTVRQLPDNINPWDAATLGDNFVTVFRAANHDLGLPLPWPKPDDYVPEHASDPILIWGGSSSVGQYALQVLRYYGYHNLLATASRHQHALLSSFGAKQCFDYRESDVAAQILNVAKHVPFILDCIGSKDGSLTP